MGFMRLQKIPGRTAGLGFGVLISAVLPFTHAETLRCLKAFGPWLHLSS